MGKRMDTKKLSEKTAKISTYRPEGSKRTYSNHVEVAISPQDISLKFCDVMPPSKENIDRLIKNEKSGEVELKVPVLTEIVLSYKVAKALIEVLKKQLDKVEEKESKI